MAIWTNHVAIAAPRNGTTAFTVNPATDAAVAGANFTPTAGRFLVCLFGAGVTATTPAGWTLPTNGSAVSNVGLYLWHRVAAGSDTVTTTAGSANFPAVFDFYEFPAGSSLLAVASAINVSRSGGTGPTLTMAAGTKFIMGVMCQGGWAGTGTVTWSAGVEAVDTSVIEVGTDDGYTYSTAYLEDSVLTSSTLAATSTQANASTVERLMFAVTIAANTTTGTLTATVPKVTASLSGAITGPTTGTVSATLPKATASVPGAVTVTGTMSAAVPRVTSSIANIVRLTIAQENALTSNLFDRNTWFDYGNDDIPGFARSSYYTPGQVAQFSVNYSSAYTCDVYRLGWYGGTSNARRVASFAGTTASQPAPATIPNSNGAVTCSAWSTNVTWSIPADATPGWYWMLMRNGGSSQFGGILFCVSDANAKQPVLVVSSEATWGAAYNGFGGNNVYGATTAVGDISQRALCSSYDKPVISRTNVPQTHFFNGELAQLRFFERFGFDVGYATSEQINNDPTVMDGRELIVFSGHNEYVSQRIYDKTEAVIQAGTNVANFAANDFFWRTAYGGTTFPTGSTSTSTGRVLWCKKDTMAGPTAVRSGGAGTPFTNQGDWTGTWQDTRYTNRKPSNTVLGDRFIANGFRSDEVKVPFAMKGSPIWRNAAGVQALTTGQTYAFGAGTAGMEWDMPDGNLPQVSLSASVVNLDDFTADVNGETYNNDSTQTHAFQMVRNGSGRIFNANTTQWGWALDDLHLRGTSIATATARQATLNVLYDLGATGVSGLITGASLTVPTPVSSIDTDYGLPVAVTGTLSATLPRVTGSVAGASLTTGTLATVAPRVTSAVAGSSLTVGGVSATLPKVTAVLSGMITGPTIGTLTASVPLLISSLTGSGLVTGSLSAVTPKLLADLTGTVIGPTTGQLVASTPVVVGSIGGVTVTVGVLSGSLPRTRARFDSATQAVVPRRLSATLRQPRFKGTMRP